MRRTVHKDKDLDSDIESEDDDDDEQPRRGDGKRPLTTRQAVLASVVGSSHVSLGVFFSFTASRQRISDQPLGIDRDTDETSRKKKQLNEAEIALRREETARKRKHLSEKKLEDEKVRIHFIFMSCPSEARARPLQLQGRNNQPSPEKEV